MLFISSFTVEEYLLLFFSNEKKKFVEWTAKDFSTDEPIKRTFRIQFSSKNAVAEFKAIFAEVRSHFVSQFCYAEHENR